MPVRTFQHSFNAGELSPRFLGLANHPKYFAGLQTCLNYLIYATGEAEYRPGLHYVEPLANHTQRACLYRFEFNITQAYLLEFSPNRLRIYRDSVLLPISLTTPYTDPQIFELQLAQSADILWIVHPDQPPYKLLRFSESNWSLQPIVFDPPPTVEIPTPGPHDLTFTSTSGPGGVDAGAPYWLDGDVGRQIAAAPGEPYQARAIITRLVFPAPSALAECTTIGTMSTLSLPAGTWQLEGPLGAALKVQGPALKGTYVEASLVGPVDMETPELVTNGDFSGGMSSWTDYSGASLASGSHTGGNDSSDLQDTTKHFPSLGVGIGQRATNTSKGKQFIISAIRPGGNALGMTIEPATDYWDTGDGYTIQGNGGVSTPGGPGGGAQLSAGPGGVAWIEQGITTTPGLAYRLQFDVYEGPLSVRLGSTTQGADIYAEATHEIGLDREILFTATSGTTFVQFRNNQPQMAKVVDVSVKRASAQGFRAEDVGSYLQVNNGVLEITALVNATTVNALVRAPMDSEDLAQAGTWSLEQPAWSATRAYPRAVSFHQQRLAYAGSYLQPLTVWMSEIGFYDSFAGSALADSSLEHEFSANEMNVILWLQPFRDLLVGTAAGEHLLRGVNGPLTPSNGEQLPQTRVGSNGLAPLRIDNALILLQRGARQVKELNFDETGATVRGRDHTLGAEQITASGIVQWAMQTKPTAILWAVRTDGTLIGLTYEQMEEVQGWHRHTTDGSIESVCVLPVNSPTDHYTEEVYVVVRRTISGASWRSVERLDPYLKVDGGLTYSGPSTTVLGGLDHLEGKTVQIVDKSSGQAAITPPQRVSAGQVTVATAVTKADVGLFYPGKLVTMPPELPLRDGTLAGRRARWLRLMARLDQSVGVTLNGQLAERRTAAHRMDEGLPPASEDIELVNLGWTAGQGITVEQTQPLPSTVLGLVGTLEWEDIN